MGGKEKSCCGDIAWGLLQFIYPFLKKKKMGNKRLLREMWGPQVLMVASAMLLILLHRQWRGLCCDRSLSIQKHILAMKSLIEATTCHSPFSFSSGTWSLSTLNMGGPDCSLFFQWTKVGKDGNVISFALDRSFGRKVLKIMFFGRHLWSSVWVYLKAGPSPKNWSCFLEMRKKRGMYVALH